MAKYKHREEGYIVEATKRDNRGYHVEDYRKPYNAFLTVSHFEELFELEYCCDWFRKCVEHRVIMQNTVGSRKWTWMELNEEFTECPFCKTKL